MASLCAAVGQEDGVGAAGGVAVTLLILAKVGAAVLVVHTILKGVVRLCGLRLLVVGLGVSIAGGRMTSLSMMEHE